MSREQYLYFRNLLLSRRRDILQRVRGLQTRWQEMMEPAIELEEEAQRTALTLPFDRLDESGTDTIEQIDLALSKMVTGDYGICETCGDDISPKRLEAVPWTRLCIDCARDLERKQQTLPAAAEVIESAELPDEYQGLSNNQILAIVNEQIEKDPRIDTEELDISLRDGVLYLEGVIAGQPERQILLQILTDILGFTSVVDHLMVSEVLFEREDRTPGKELPPATGAIEDRLLYDQEELTEDLFEAGDEKPYSPPERPLPHQEYDRNARGRERTI